MKMAAALIQCMIRSGNGCRRGGDVARDGVAIDNAPACAIESIRNCRSDKTVKKAVFKLEPLRASHIVVVPEVEQVADVEDHRLIALIAEVFLVALWPEEPRLSGAGRIAA
jgi:hypothetical protein